MSWHLVGPIMRLNLPLAAKMVLVVYGNESNSEGEQIGVSVEMAALVAGASERTVQNHVKAFQADGVLIETREEVGRGRARIWRLNVERAARLYGKIPTYRERRALKEKGESPAPFAKPGKGAGNSEKGAGDSEKGAAPAPTPIKDPIETPARPAAAAVAKGAAGDPLSNPALPPWSAAWRGVREFWADLGQSDADIDAWETDLYRWASNEASLNWPHAKLVMWWALKRIHGEGPAADKITARAMAMVKGQRGGELLELALAEAERHDQSRKELAS